MGKGAREDPTQLFFTFPLQWMGGEEEIAGEFVLNVSYV
jgi:hypothetical protein